MGDESILDLYADLNGDFSPLPTGSDDPSVSFGSRNWEDDDQEVEHYSRTKPTRDQRTPSQQNSSDKRVGLTGKSSTSEAPHSSKESMVFSHNVATIWTTLKDVIGSLLKQAASGKALMLSCTTSLSEQMDTLPLLLPFQLTIPRSVGARIGRRYLVSCIFPSHRT